MSLILTIFAALLITIVVIYLWYSLQSKRIKLNCVKFYIVVILQTILSVINYDFINNYLRMFIIFSLMIINFKWLFKTNLQKTIITVFFTELIIIVSECIYVIILSLILNLNTNSLLKWFEGTLAIDIGVSIIAILLSRFKFIKKLYNKLLKITDNIKTYQLFTFIIISLSSLSYVYFVSYYSPNLLFTVILNFIICLVYMVIIFINFYNKNKYNTIYAKYNNSIKDLLSYERLNDKNNMLIHENKNTLRTIQSMTKNKKIINFIDNTLNHKYIYNNTVDDELVVIPYGGLKGLLHSKITYMKDNKINYLLLIDKKIKYSDLKLINDELIVKICEILGVLFDNAIEEVVKKDDFDMQVNIFKEDECFCFSISNNYINMIDYNKLGVKRITSKGENHGYGLMLVKTIVNSDDRINLITSVQKDTFKQILKINIKK